MWATGAFSLLLPRAGYLYTISAEKAGYYPQCVAVSDAIEDFFSQAHRYRGAGSAIRRLCQLTSSVNLIPCFEAPGEETCASVAKSRLFLSSFSLSHDAQKAFF
jgi:hypothetical protein